MNQRIQKRLFDLSKALSPIHRCHRCSHIAYLLKHNKIVHIGFNKIKTHPLLKYYPKHSNGIHAELDVIMKSNMDDLSSYTLVVIRVGRNGKITMSKPCKSCQNIISQYNIFECYYSDFNGNLKKL